MQLKHSAWGQLLGVQRALPPMRKVADSVLCGSGSWMVVSGTSNEAAPELLYQALLMKTTSGCDPLINMLPPSYSRLPWSFHIYMTSQWIVPHGRQNAPVSLHKLRWAHQSDVILWCAPPTMFMLCCVHSTKRFQGKRVRMFNNTKGTVVEHNSVDKHNLLSSLDKSQTNTELTHIPNFVTYLDQPQEQMN